MQVNFSRRDAARLVNTLVSGLLAGICISIGGTVFLSVENKIIGRHCSALDCFWWYPSNSGCLPGGSVMYSATRLFIFCHWQPLCLATFAARFAPHLPCSIPVWASALPKGLCRFVSPSWRITCAAFLSWRYSAVF